MTNLMVYLLEASILLIVLYALYAVALRKLTFHNLNRFFLLSILGLSMVIPLLRFDLSVPVERVVSTPVAELADARQAYYQALDDWVFEAGSGSSGLEIASASMSDSSTAKRRIANIVLLVYLIGAVALVSRSFWTYAWMHRLRSRHAKEVIDGVLVVKVPYPMAPFSFMNAVFVHEEMLHDEGFQQILAHEKTHIKQRHSVDLIIVQLIAAFLWFNPVVWRLIKSLKATHEYIVDKQMINRGYSLVEYQTLLLRQLISNNSYGLVHHFNLSFIKKRITMMKIKESGPAGKAKVAVVFAAVVTFSLVIVQCNSKIDEQQLQVFETAAADLSQGDISYPVVTLSGYYKLDVDLSDAMTFRISRDVLKVDGKEMTLAEIPTAIEEAKPGDHSVMVLEVDKDQEMGLVREVQNILRVADKRKVLYRAISTQNEALQLAIQLPPDPNSASGIKLPTITDEYAKEHGIEVMKVKVSDNLGVKYEQVTRDFVKTHSDGGDYVVSVKYEDDDSFDDYFINLFHVYRGFDLIYDERARELFGKNFYEIDTSTPKGKEQYHAVRKGIPRAISIAEKD